MVEGVDREFLRQVWHNGWFVAGDDLWFSDGRHYGVQRRGIPAFDDPYRYDGVELIEAGSGSLVMGSMRLDAQSSDWVHTDENQGVVWHLVGDRNRIVLSPHGGELLTAVLTPAQRLVACREKMAADCEAYFAGLEPVERYDLLHQLAARRIERKGLEVVAIQQQAGDWNETAYLMLLRALGSPSYKESFERVGRAIPWSILMRDRLNEPRAEALLLGAAGFLGLEHPDDYTEQLQGLWRAYRTERSLDWVAGIDWNGGRGRPLSAPAVGLVRAAGLVCRVGSLGERLWEAAGSVDTLRSLFDIRLSAYWCYHLAPSHPAPRGMKPDVMSLERIDRILINAVVPYFWAYGTMQQRAEWVDRSIELLDALSVEANRYTRRFEVQTIRFRSALESQGIIELCTAYCEKQGCSACPMAGHRLHRVYHNQSR